MGLYIQYAGLGALLVLFSIIARAFYNLFLHPLARFPGPKLYAAFDLTFCIQQLKGTNNEVVKALHEQYGHVVRIAPNEVSFTTPDAWTPLFVKRYPDFVMPKDKAMYAAMIDTEAIGTAGDIVHRRLRRSLAPAFTARGQKELEPRLKDFTGMLMAKLQEQVNGPSKGNVDICMWVKLTLFDFLGDIAFGESFGCLQMNDYHPWVKFADSVQRVMEVMYVLRKYGLDQIMMKLAPKSQMEEFETHQRLTKETMQRRVDLGGSSRKDIVSHLLAAKGPDGLTQAEIEVQGQVLILAGSDTTATGLLGLICRLMQRPDAYEKLTNEIRNAFSSEDQIDIRSTDPLKYLSACCDEGLRLHPPATATPRRIIPKGGVEVKGRLVPAGTTVGINHLATFHSSRNFKDAESFYPERWLGEDRFKDDRLTACHPFSLGARNCVAQGFALSTMRVILATLLLKYDMKLAPGQDISAALEKSYYPYPYNVILTPRLSEKA
ncbi:MAG: hypothetical protein M1814_006149 [Vezdaea aestivalis]|nr:MAG: hypothetical protein M1814_006149 [Vezdaea aestivalis]